jgi:hypothetical protein
MENIRLLNQLLHLTSTAEYFNDVLFSLDDDQFKFPVYLVNDIDDLEVEESSFESYDGVNEEEDGYFS